MNAPNARRFLQRQFVWFTLFLVQAVAMGAATRPNILVFLSDDHSFPHVGCYDNPDLHTPNLDRFAAQGMRFDRAYVTASQCVPSRASIMTGRSPVRIGMTRFSAPLPMDIKTFPELLRESGYFTGVAGRGYHLDGARTDASSRVFDKHNLQTFSRRLDFVNQVSAERGPEYNDQVFAQYREFLDAVPKGKSFFLQLCASDPHRPFDGKGIPSPRDPARLKLPAWFPDVPEVRKDFADYLDEISRLDEVFGQVMVELEQRGLATNTLVIFMGDNGASQLRGKGTLYEFGIHVPLLVRWPGVVKPGSANSELVSGEDIGPTALQAARVSVPSDWTGKNLLPLLNGEVFSGREAIFAERGPHASGLPGSTSSFDLGRAVVTKTHKLIYNALFQLPYTPIDFSGGPAWKATRKAAESGKVPPALVPYYTGKERPLFELYDLTNDPNELNNLAGQPGASAIERKLKSMLHEWMILERDYLPLPINGRARRNPDQ
jgi:N-sulfoglucosamine sulfohydrolase